MKKFGTPIGAGPGSDSEKDGLAADGTPLPEGSDVWWCLALLCGFAPLPPCVVVLGEGCEEPFWRFPGRLGFGLEPDPEVVVEDEELEPDFERDGGVELDDVVVDEEVVVRVGAATDTVGVEDEDEGAQDSLSEVITPLTGRLSEETGVPAGTLT
jgi:hypothetical protein